MKISLKAAIAASISAFAMMVSPLSALAVNITYSAATIVNFDALGITATIASGSEADSVVVNTGTLVVVIPTSSVFTLTSSARDLTATGMSSAATYAKSCTSGTASAAVTAGSGGTETITFTPSGNSCSPTGGGGGGSGGGGGGGGGGGSTTSTTPTTPAPTGSLSMSGGGAHSNGTLVLDGSTIWLIKDGKRYGFRNSDEYKSHGYNFGQAVAANAQDKALPQAEFVQKALEGTLVLDASDGKTVYMIGVGGTKRGFASAEVFKALGYSFGSLPKINLSDYPAGAPINSASEPHPEGALVRQSNGTVWWILAGKKQGFESMAVFNTYGFLTSRLVKASEADLALTEGSLVKFRDGTLVKDGSNYYLISDGKKVMFASAADLAAKGYKASNAISASLTNY